MPIAPQLATRFAAMSPALFRDLLVGHARLTRGTAAPLLDATREVANWQQRDVQLAWHVLGLYCDYVYGVVGDPGNVRLLPPGGEVDHEASFSRFCEGLMDLRESLAIGADYLSELWPHLARKVLPGRSESEVIAWFTRAMGAAHYPYPATLDFVPPILLHYLAPRLCNGDLMRMAEFGLHLTAGASDGFVQVAHTLARNGLLSPGDRVALWPPDADLADLFGRQLGCTVAPVARSTDRTPTTDDWTLLTAPEVKLLVLASDGARVPAAADGAVLAALAPTLPARPDLLVVADCTGVGLQSEPTATVLSRWPRQTLGVYSFSRDFGLAGARLGVVMAHRECLADEWLRSLPPTRREANDQRYAGRLPRPTEAGFLARLVEESAGVAFGHRGGLPTPNQVLLCLCASYEAVNESLASAYTAWVREELKRRQMAFHAGLGAPPPAPEEAVGGSLVLTAERLANALGPDATVGLRQGDWWTLLFHLAHAWGLIVLADAPGPGGPGALRVSLLGMGEAQCLQAGQTLAEALATFGREGPCAQCVALLGETLTR